MKTCKLVLKQNKDLRLEIQSNQTKTPEQTILLLSKYL